MRKASKAIGIAAFLLVEAAVLFGSYVVASVRCCQTVAAVGPADGGEWAALIIFGIVMVVPAAMIGAGAAVVAEGVAHAIGLIAARRRDR